MEHKSGSVHRLTSYEMPVNYLYQRQQPVTAGVGNGCIALLLCLFISATFPGVVAAASPGPGGGPPPPLVTVATVTEQDVNPPAQYVGHVEAMQTVDLRARVEGFLEQIQFKEGGDIRLGDLLYVIEKGPYQAQVDADKAGIAQAQAALTSAGQHLKRLRAARSESVPATDMDNAVAKDLGARAELQEAQAALERSELNLGYTKIWAPISGRIGRTAYTRGNLVGPASDPLARIVQLDPIRVVFSISENDLPSVNAALGDSSPDNKNQALTLRISLSSGDVLDTIGHVDFVDNTVDAYTGTIAVWALFDNPAGTLLPGQYVTVLVSRSEANLLPVVPQSSVQEDREGRYVMVVDDKNQVVMRRIKTGPLMGENWVVESGLGAGEKVIIQGVQKVQPGMTVKATTADKGQGR